MSARFPAPTWWQLDTVRVLLETQAARIIFYGKNKATVVDPRSDPLSHPGDSDGSVLQAGELKVKKLVVATADLLRSTPPFLERSSVGDAQVLRRADDPVAAEKQLPRESACRMCSTKHGLVDHRSGCSLDFPNRGDDLVQLKVPAPLIGPVVSTVCAAWRLAVSCVASKYCFFEACMWRFNSTRRHVGLAGIQALHTHSLGIPTYLGRYVSLYAGSRCRHSRLDYVGRGRRCSGRPRLGRLSTDLPLKRLRIDVQL